MENTGCFGRRQNLGSYHPHGGSQHLVCGIQYLHLASMVIVHMWYRDICASKYVHINKWTSKLFSSVSGDSINLAQFYKDKRNHVQVGSVQFLEGAVNTSNKSSITLPAYFTEGVHWHTSDHGLMKYKGTAGGPWLVAQERRTQPEKAEEGMASAQKHPVRWTCFFIFETPLNHLRCSQCYLPSLHIYNFYKIIQVD